LVTADHSGAATLRVLYHELAGEFQKRSLFSTLEGRRFPCRLNATVPSPWIHGEVESEEHALDPRLMTLAGRAVAWLSTRYLSDRRETRADSSFVNTVEIHRILGLLEELDYAVSNTGESSVAVQLLSACSAQVRLMASGE